MEGGSAEQRQVQFQEMQRQEMQEQQANQDGYQQQKRKEGGIKLEEQKREGMSEKEGMIKLKGLFGLLVNTEEETVVRPAAMPVPLVPPQLNFVEGVASRDVVISDSPPIWARVFLPEKVSRKNARNGSSSSSSSSKAPVLLYFHGGGFVMLSPAIAFYHQLCAKIARRCGAIVVSVDYRLAPEHRLPAAYDDAYTALHWLLSIRQSQDQEQQTQGQQQQSQEEQQQQNVQEQIEEQQQDPWLTAYADMGRIFVMGDSAGANIAHHLSLRLVEEAAEAAEEAAEEGRDDGAAKGPSPSAAGGPNPSPARGTSPGKGGAAAAIRGVVLVQPMTSGAERMRSEVEGARSGFYAYETNEWLWRLALPRGAGLVHPYCDLAAAVRPAAAAGQGATGAAGQGATGAAGQGATRATGQGTAMMVVVGGLDWMHDRQFEFVAALRRSGRRVELVDFEHGKHGFFISDSPDTDKFLRLLSAFVLKHSQ